MTLTPGSLDRYATPATSAPLLAHLLPADTPPAGGRPKPALCGEPRIQWHPVGTFPRPSVYRPCPKCTAAHPQAAAPPPTRFAAAPHRTPGRTAALPSMTAITPAVAATQTERVTRRAHYRDHGLTRHL